MSGMRSTLIPRWNSILGDKRLIVQSLKDLLPDIRPNRRGQPPKQSIKEYLILVVLKENKIASLRNAEIDWSEYVCGERVDHSVIAYWEKKFPSELIDECVRAIGSKLEELLGYNFSVVDGTSFSNWHNRLFGFHLLTRIAEGTVYPVSICPDTLDPVPNTRDVIVPGYGLFMGDKWYDVNKVFRLIYENGYIPLVKPNKTRGRGHWRRKARKIYNTLTGRMEYRNRGRGESPFGSLTNNYGDRLNTRLKETTYTRSVARVIAYQVKIYIRATNDSTIGYWMNN